LRVVCNARRESRGLMPASEYPEGSDLRQSDAYDSVFTLTRPWSDQVAATARLMFGKQVVRTPSVMALRSMRRPSLVFKYRHAAAGGRQVCGKNKGGLAA